MAPKRKRRKFRSFGICTCCEAVLTLRRYINLGHGDEPLEEIYGDNLARLRELKREWDPENRFNQWFNIV